MKYTLQPWRLRLIMVLGLTPIFVGTLFSFYTWRSQASQTYQYPYVVMEMGTQSLQNEIEFYKQRIQRNPHDGLDRAALAGAYLKLARSTGETVHYHQAEEMAQQSFANLPNTEAQLVLARVAEAEHDFSTTLNIARQVLQAEPNNPEAQSLLVTSNLALGKLTEASQIAQQLVDQAPTFGTMTLRALVHDAQGQDTEAIRWFEQALAAEEPGEAISSAKTRTLMGRFYTQRGQTQKARRLFQEALRIVPQHSFALLEQAKLETLDGNYQQAEALYAQVDSASEHDALYGRAIVKLQQGDRAAALKLLNQAEQAFRHSHQPGTDHHHDHGEDHHHGHSHDHGEDHHHTPESSQSAFGHRRDLARVLLTRGTAADRKEALALMEVEIKIRRDAQTVDTLAWALQANDQMQAAQAILQDAIAQGTWNAKLFYRAGMVAHALGNQQQSATYFQKAQAINPTLNSNDRLGGVTALAI